ncbi:peptide ABC transporter substrate-binding protein [Clostridium sp. KNHs214]|uniref:peptide ABC transporter substrate-binding protein n=1 Tax=Clostridium sp. KNHs214 TaxID=1540257 RepID=UPI000554FB5F|nr:peptide ABC transporter substrate-binding protein [Clostridium sp. KNHs214]
MRSKKLISLVLGTTLIFSTALLGCGSKDDQGKTASNGEKIDKDQYLNLVVSEEPKTLDASVGNDDVSYQILKEVTEPLTRLEQDKNGNDIIKPAAAEKWETNNDGTEWTFHLRDNKWSDGKKVTAKDFEYGIKRTINPKTGSTYAFLLSPIKGADECMAGKGSVDSIGVKAVDDKTLKFELKGPCSYFLGISYFRVMLPQRQDLIEKHGEKYGTELDKLAFCGPFVMKKWEHSSEIVLEKNKDYWDKDSVKLDKVNLKMIKDGNSAANSVYNGSVDALEITKPEWIKKLDNTNKFDIVKGYNPDISFEFFNTKDKLFKNVNIRKAFSIAMDREDIAKVIFHGQYEAGYGWCPPKVQMGANGEYRKMANEEPAKKLKQDNPDPKALLVKGLKELGMDSDPSKITITVLYSGTNQGTRTGAEYDQQMFKKKLGINVKSEYVEWPVFQKRINEYDYQMAGLIWGADYNDPSALFDLFITGADMIPTGWQSKKYDEIVKEARITLDEKKRLELYKEAEKMLVYDEAVVAPKLYTKRNMYVYKYVKNLMNPLFGVREFKYAYTQGRDK